MRIRRNMLILLTLVFSLSFTTISFASETTNDFDKVVEKLTEMQEQNQTHNEMLIQNTYDILFWIKVIILGALIGISIYLAVLFIKRVVIKIINYSTKGMSL